MVQVLEGMTQPVQEALLQHGPSGGPITDDELAGPCGFTHLVHGRFDGLEVLLVLEGQYGLDEGQLAGFHGAEYEPADQLTLGR